MSRELQPGSPVKIGEGLQPVLDRLKDRVVSSDSPEYLEWEESRQRSLRDHFAAEANIPSHILDLYNSAWQETAKIKSLHDYLEQGKRIVILYGARGRGKSFAAATALLKPVFCDVTGPRHVGEWVTASEYCQWCNLRDTVYLAERCARSIYLVIDDLGEETKKDSPRLSLLISRRYNNSSARTIVTTNLTGAEVRQRYGPRVTDRIREIGVAIKFEERMRK